MTSTRIPLLADHRHRLSSSGSDRRVEREKAARRSSSHRSHPSWKVTFREAVLFIWALLATANAIFLAVWVQHRSATRSPGNATAQRTPSKRNLVFMISDGMGPTSLSLTRSFRQLSEGLPIDDVLTLDKHLWGSSRTRSSSSIITDSAAGATAFSCGKKSYNGAISMLPDFTPCGTVLEAAKRAGYKTGLVVTTDVTDATPATFASHVHLRQQQDEIALQEVGEGPLGRTVDLILGGGRCHFMPNTSTAHLSCRRDDVDVSKLAQEKHGWSYADTRAGFDAMQRGANISLPALGLFATADIPFEVDRSTMADTYPSLSEMAVTALRALNEASVDAEKGFFLMIEGSRIDHAGHINDPAAQVREVLEYDRTFQLVLDFFAKHDDQDTESVLIATSDHETGGLATAWQSPDGELPVYRWYPQVLERANASSEHCARLLHAYILSHPDISADELMLWINTEVVRARLGIENALETELNALATVPEAATILFARMISHRARVGWTTGGHSAVDVNVYSSGGRTAEDIRGNVENTDIGRFLARFLGVDVQSVTRELRKKMGGLVVGEDVLAAARAEEGLDVNEVVDRQVTESLLETDL